MIFVEVDPVVMHATSITPASWVLLVLADAAVAVAHVAPKFLGLPQSGRHVGSPDGKGQSLTFLINTRTRRLSVFAPVHLAHRYRLQVMKTPSTVI